jgi:RNA polymerase sigma-70 factor (ECF subfamily)
MSKVPHTLYDEDAEQVNSWRHGELASFETLVEKHQKLMFNIAFTISGNYEEACEVVQDAFLTAYRGIDSFRGAARFSTLLTSITINLCRNRLQQIRTKQDNEVFTLGEPSAAKGYGQNRVQPSPDPPALGQPESYALYDRLRDCISGLDADFREPIVLRDVQEFSYDEICAILKVREETVKARLFRGREMVKDALKRAVGEL